MKKIYEKTMKHVTGNDFDFNASTVHELISYCFYDEYYNADECDGIEYSIELAVAWAKYILEEVGKIDFPYDKADELLKIANTIKIIDFMVACKMEKKLIDALDEGNLFDYDFISTLLADLEYDVDPQLWIMSFLYIPEYAKVLFDEIEESGYLEDFACIPEILRIVDDEFRKKLTDIATEKSDSWIWANIINILPNGTNLFFERIPLQELVEVVYGMFDCRFSDSTIAVDALYCITEFICDNKMIETGKELLKLNENTSFRFGSELYAVERMVNNERSGELNDNSNEDDDEEWDW